MIGTLEMMKGIIEGKEKELNEKDIIKNYKFNNNSEALAFMFVKCFGVATMISSTFKEIDEQDKASFCLSTLDKALRYYDKSKGTKFTTYFCHIYKLKLIKETEFLKCDKRRRLNDMEDISECTEYKTEDVYFLNVDDIAKNYDLTQKEKKHLQLLDDGYTLKQISDKLQLSMASIYKRNSLVKNKILNAL